MALRKNDEQISVCSKDLICHLQQQNLEIDALLRLEINKTELELEYAARRHVRALMMPLAQEAARRMTEKEVEVETALRRNTELEETARCMLAERQVWLHAMLNSEAAAVRLRHALLCAAATASSSSSSSASARDVHRDESCRHGEAERPWRRQCRVCGEREERVVVLPCRHLCVCRECAQAAAACPVCRGTKSGIVEVAVG